MIICKGGKSNLEEIKVTENAEELKAKDYALALERMQNALKREQQIKIVKQMNKKNKMIVCYAQLLYHWSELLNIHNHLQDTVKRGHIGQLQSQVQRTDFNEVEIDFNIPESWKWENQTNVKDRKERKGPHVKC